VQFLMNSDLRHNSYLRTLLILFLVFTFLYLSLNIGLEYSRLGLFPDQIRDNLLGNPESFLPAKDLATLFTDLHVNLFIYPLMVMTVVSILVHTKISNKAKTLWIIVPSLAILIEICGLLGARFVHPFLVWMKIVGFFLFETSMFAMVFKVFVYLISRPDDHKPKDHFHHG
jgi:hypothetical protein